MTFPTAPHSDKSRGSRDTDPLRRRYAVAGTGHRAWMYIDAILGADAEERVDVVVVTSPNYTHADLVSRTLAPSGSPAGRSRPW